MRGKFICVKKFLNKFCFITTEDGQEIFMHKNDLLYPKDWNTLVYDGNLCDFDVKVEEGKKRLRAVNVVPDQNLDPLRKIKEINKSIQFLQQQKKKHKKEIGREIHEKEQIKHQRNLQWENYIKEHLYYIIIVKENEKWHIHQPIVLYKSIEECKQEKQKLKNNPFNSENTYNIYSVLKFEIGNKIILKKLIKHKNKYKDEIGEIIVKSNKDKLIIKESENIA